MRLLAPVASFCLYTDAGPSMVGSEVVCSGCEVRRKSLSIPISGKKTERALSFLAHVSELPRDAQMIFQGSGEENV